MAPWTEAEKLKVLIQMIDSSPINWKAIDLPEGRDLKSVQNMYQSEKKKVGLVGAIKSMAKNDSDITPTQTPKKQTLKKASAKKNKTADPQTPTKRKKQATEDDEEKVLSESPRKKIKTERDSSDSPEVKAEHSSDGQIDDSITLNTSG